jgi:hypothetical protein
LAAKRSFGIGADPGHREHRKPSTSVPNGANRSALWIGSRLSAGRSGRIPITVRLRSIRRVSASFLSRSASSNLLETRGTYANKSSCFDARFFMAIAHFVSAGFAALENARAAACGH